MSTMASEDGCGTPKDFHECVSQDQLREAIEQGQQLMTKHYHPGNYRSHHGPQAP
jgi:hypothetical protein